MKKVVLLIFIFTFLLILNPESVDSQGPTPPPGSGCMKWKPQVAGCTRQYPYFCTDNATFWWCCVDSSHCIPPPSSSVDTGEPVMAETCEIMGAEGVMTALGCIPTKDTNIFVAWLLKFAIGVAGGIAALLMAFGGLMIIFSGGDPERVKGGKSILTSAIIGLVIIIFSVFLLQFVGVQLFMLPGFGTP